MKRFFLVQMAVVSMLLGVVVMNGCKSPEKPKAVITVIDVGGDAVKGATVKLYCEDCTSCIPVKACSFKSGGSNVKELEDDTDSDGQVEFEIDLPAVLRILVSASVFVDTATVTAIGEGFVKMEEGENAKETITISAGP